jgi:hypothetical protein
MEAARGLPGSGGAGILACLQTLEKSPGLEEIVMKRAVLLAAVVTLLLAGSFPAEAAVLKKWSVGVSAQGGFEKVDADTKWQDSTIAGARLGLSIRPAFQVEVSYDSFTTEPDEDDLGIGDITTTYTGLRFVGTFFAEEDVNVMPYVAAGVGKMETEMDLDTTGETLTDEHTYGELSFGARVFLWRTFHVRGELGFRQGRTFETTQTNTHLTVGFAYLFGGVE